MSLTKSELESIIQIAYQNKTVLHIRGGESKGFYGRKISGESLSLSGYGGVTEYEPSELYIMAKSGTLLSEIETIISEHNQMLPCEPPHFSYSATLGGMTAAGLAGPRRAHAGGVRDCVLGTEIINGKGETLHFGGKVMKNVAGYDASRLMCGALGTLGVITEVTLRLLPKPEEEKTIVFNMDEDLAISKLNQWANTPLPISANFYDGEHLYVRLSGSSSTIQSAAKEMGGESYAENALFWESIKEQTHEFYNSKQALWKLSVPPNSPKLNLSGECALEWNGSLRWYKTEESDSVIQNSATEVGGNATLFKGGITNDKFHPLSQASLKIHKNLKQVFDPAGILNPGKMYSEF